MNALKLNHMNTSFVSRD